MLLTFRWRVDGARAGLDKVQGRTLARALLNGTEDPPGEVYDQCE